MSMVRLRFILPLTKMLVQTSRRVQHWGWVCGAGVEARPVKAQLPRRARREQPAEWAWTKEASAQRGGVDNSLRAFLATKANTSDPTFPQRAEHRHPGGLVMPKISRKLLHLLPSPWEPLT